MLYKLLAAVLVAQSAAFMAPASVVAQSRTAAPTMADTSWRRAYNGQAGGAAVAAAPAAAAPAAASGSMSVGQACAFMEMEASTSFEDKKAFLLSKGVSEFVIAEAACTAPDTTLVL